MYILSIDPGSEHSGIAVYDSDNHRVLRTDDVSNTSLLGTIRNWDSSQWSIPGAVMAIEGLENQGHFVGRSTFDTAEWIGRFREAWEVSGRKSYKISRRDVKTVMCGGSTYRDPDTGAQKTVKDAQVNQAVRSRFPATGGGKRPEVGTKAQKGPLYGVKGSHQYSAIAIALTCMEIHGRKEGTQ
ncbi:MAG: hypothetical protein U9Q07_03825 [Planctomycetota bacterium]|nr:hypothetical protein [Planctomycetota bacterium]